MSQLNKFYKLITLTLLQNCFLMEIKLKIKKIQATKVIQLYQFNGFENSPDCFEEGDVQPLCDCFEEPHVIGNVIERRSSRRRYR
jgi:hypothetical protein